MEVYIDDMITNSVYASDHARHLRFMVQHRGIEDNPDKIWVVLGMKSPGTIKEVQSLACWIAALSRFISKAIDRCKPFFKASKAGKKLQ